MRLLLIALLTVALLAVNDFRVPMADAAALPWRAAFAAAVIAAAAAWGAWGWHDGRGRGTVDGTI